MSYETMGKLPPPFGWQKGSKPQVPDTTVRERSPSTPYLEFQDLPSPQVVMQTLTRPEQ